jgi:DNA polymerase
VPSRRIRKSAEAASARTPETEPAPQERSARPYVPPSKSIDTLRKAAADCRGCDLHARATQVVFGAGPRGARVMLIGEQPGDKEDIMGAPFVSPAGAMLRRALDEVGLAPEDTYVTNAVKHFSWEPRGKRRIHKKPRASEVKACRPWLDAELQAVRPAVLVCLGATAAQSLLGSSFKLMANRGHPIETPDGTIVATIHPSALLRAPDHDAREAAYASFVQDLRVAVGVIKK